VLSKSGSLVSRASPFLRSCSSWIRHRPPRPVYATGRIVLGVEMCGNDFRVPTPSHCHDFVPIPILTFGNLRLYSNSDLFPIPSHSHSTDTQSFKNSYSRPSARRRMSTTQNHSLVYYSTLVSHSTHYWSENDVLGWRSDQCKVKMNVLSQLQQLDLQQI